MRRPATAAVVVALLWAVLLTPLAWAQSLELQVGSRDLYADLPFTLAVVASDPLFRNTLISAQGMVSLIFSAS